MIVLWGLASDGPLASVRDALARSRAPSVFLDQRELAKATLSLTLDGSVRGTIESPGASVDLASVTAAYIRPYDVRQVLSASGTDDDPTCVHRALELEDALGSWSEATPGLVVNRPSAMASNNSKPLQLAMIRAVGFDVPDTLVTTDATAALQFWERHGAVIYKSVSGVRSIVRKLGPEHRGRMKDVSHCPTQLQEYVAGTDFRVHVVGDEVYACEIESTADDYRYPERQRASVTFRASSVPGPIAELCRRVTASLNLVVSGVDLRRTPGGRWVAFEVNPSPGFTVYEEATGHPIAASIASLMAGA